MRRYFLLLYLFFATAPYALAATVYVNDALYLGLHQDKTLASPILELIPSGTELELLGKEQNLFKVRIKSGITGWVDGSYITDKVPVRTTLTNLEAQLQTQEQQIADLEKTLQAAQQRADDAELKLSQAAEKAPVVQTKTAIPSSTLRELQNLAEENQRLKQQVAELEAVQTMAVEQAQAAEKAQKQLKDAEPAKQKSPLPTATIANTSPMASLNEWQLLFLGSVLLFAFAIGGWAVDLSVRRRHGGHRI